MSTATKRACDACHRRKVRCNGSNPCQNCVQASLACTFNKPPMKKGPKGSRAKVISELRKSQDKAAHGMDGPLSPLESPTFARHRDLLTPDLVESSVSYFFENMYPTLPILHRSWVQQRVAEMYSSVESYCLVGSLCAFMVIQPGVQAASAMSPADASKPLSSSPIQQNTDFGLRIMEDTKRRRSLVDYIDNPTTASILTSFFISAGLFGLEKHTNAWFHLQEAILFARILRIHDEKSYVNPGPLETMNRRLFWLLFVSERAQALQKHRDLTFHETIDFPKPEEDPQEIVAIPGLTGLYNLFSVVDDRVSEIWNNLRAQSPVVWPADSAVWLARIQRQLTDALPADLKVTEIQEVDLITTQLWLRSIVWQLSTASGCLSSTASDPSMTLSYPIELARQLVALSYRVSLSSMEVHGIGLVEKLFDVAYTLIDVMTVVPLESATFELGPRDHLARILSLMTTLRNGETRFVQLLQAKIRDSLPSLAVSMALPPAPAGAPFERFSKYEEGSAASTTSSPYGSPPSRGVALSTTHYPTFAHSHTTPEQPSPSASSVTMSLGSPTLSEASVVPVMKLEAPSSYPIQFATGPPPGYQG